MHTFFCVLIDSIEQRFYNQRKIPMSLHTHAHHSTGQGTHSHPPCISESCIKPGIAQFTEHDPTDADNEACAVEYDLLRNVVVFDGCACYHKNADWEGDRYVVVVFNNDFSHHDRARGLHGPDPRTEELRCLPTPDVPECIAIDRTQPQYIKLRRAIAKEIQNCEFMNRPQSKYSGKSEVLLFGECTQPYKHKCRRQTKNTEIYSKLYSLLKEYMDYVTGPAMTTRGEPAASQQFSTMLLAKNSKCNWHLDKQNVGHSMITGLGDYKEPTRARGRGGSSSVVSPAEEDVCAVDYEGGKLLVNHTKLPLWECYDCHIHNRCKRICRIEGRHTGEDWLNVVWRKMKSGELACDPTVPTRITIRNSLQHWRASSSKTRKARVPSKDGARHCRMAGVPRRGATDLSGPSGGTA
jgi:hypothetical protein